MGHHVTGVDLNEIAGVHERTDAFFRADLNEGIPPEVGTGFDIVLAADVLEHLVESRGPDAAGAQRARPRGHGHLLRAQHRPLVPAVPVDLRDVRLRPARDPRLHPPAVLHPPEHPKLIERQGFTVRRLEPVGLPLDALGVEGGKAQWLRLADHMLLTMWPTMFGYQFIIEATPNPE